MDIELEPLRKKLLERSISFQVKDKVKEYLAHTGFDQHFGARPLKRTIQRYIQDPLSVKLLDGSLKEGSKITVDLNEDKKIVFREDKT